MTTLRDSSKGSWNSAGTLEQINAGSLQRIADAMELSCKDREKLEHDYRYMRNQRDYLSERNQKLTRSNAALRGLIKRMKKAQAVQP